ncbi:flavoprotein-like protein [Syncephalis fuscata]|nr:flavoprotein-like protein [Syncephalis fuscata]
MSAAKVYVVYYSMYGHVGKLARAIAQGARRVPKVDVKMYQIQETLSDDILALMKAPPRDKTIPVIDPMELADADGILLGNPTRFGILWTNNTLRNKLIGTFYSTNSQHGGQETTTLTMMPYVIHLGMQFVPFGYSHPALNEPKVITGGSPYGASTVAAADGERPSKIELEIAEAQGEHFAQETLIRVLGREAFEKRK